ncbi:MAG: TolC family protein [Acidobacteria bacterium]|nr:TolC family protein [Acidobacteriota bacterium]
MNLPESKSGARRRMLRPARAAVCLTVLCLPQSIAAAQIPGGWSVQYPPASTLGGITRPYRAKAIPPAEFSNSARVDALMRAGRLYLSLQDAIALALENNLDIELQRYGPRIAQTDLERAEAGGALRGASTATQTASESTSASVTQGTSAGTSIPSLDPTLVGQLNWSHRSLPQTNSFSTGTSYLVSNSRLSNFGIQKGFLTGTILNFGWNNNWLDQNSARADFNPSTAASFNMTITQRLLQGFGLAVNSRNIRIAKNNQQVSDLVFEQQVIATVSSVIGIYWDLVSLNDEVKVRRQTLALSQKLLDDNKQRVDLGSLAAFEIARTEAEVARAEQDLTISETALLQQETILKNALTRSGVASYSLATARIIPTDPLRVPGSGPVEPIQDLVAKALANRPELGQLGLQIQNTKLGIKGTKSALLPSLDLVANVQNNALAGQINSLPIPPVQGSSLAPQPRSPNSVDPFFLGGYGTALSQLFSRNFPDYAIGVQLTIPLRNRAAQADMVRDQLSLRQQEIRRKQLENQVQVDVQNALTAVQQARARHQAAMKSRVYQEQTYEGEQGKYELGASTSYFVIQAQRDLAAARSAEIVALSAYNKARTELDKATGQTISASNIVIEEARRGRVSREPAPLPVLDRE